MSDLLDHLDPLVDERNLTRDESIRLEKRRLAASIKRAEIRLKELEKREKESK